MYGITWDALTAIFFRWRKPWSIQNALKQFAAVPEPALEEKDVDSTLAKLTAGYHRSTGS